MSWPALEHEVFRLQSNNLTICTTAATCNDVVLYRLNNFSLIMAIDTNHSLLRNMFCCKLEYMYMNILIHFYVWFIIIGGHLCISIRPSLRSHYASCQSYQKEEF